MANSDTIRYDTEGMRQMSSTIKSDAEDYLDNINGLYNEVEDFTSSDGFRGRLSNEFFETFASKKDFFIDNKTVINDCSTYLANHSTDIDGTEEQLLNNIRRHNYFE